MALEQVGLTKGKIDNLRWSLMGDGIGTSSDFATPGAFAPSVGAGVREVIFAPGRASAWGVDITNTAPTSLTIPEALGSPRAWACCIERNWADGSYQLVRLDCGGPAKVRPSSARSRRNGDNTDHQLICYAVATPGSTQVQITPARFWADKSGVAESIEALGWDPAPGRLARVASDGRWYQGSPDVSSGLTSNLPAMRQILSFEWNGIMKQQIGADGSLRLTWPVPGSNLGFTPRVVNAWVHIAASTNPSLLVYPDINNPATASFGWFFLRTPSGVAYVPSSAASPTTVVISRITATVVEA
jgi:hypothetical protein